jgi:tRNA-dihydrouridine synthase
MIRAYFQMLLDEQEACKDLPRSDRMGETAGKMKQFATWFTHGVPGGAKLRAAIYQAKTGAAVLAQVEEFFATFRKALLENDQLNDSADPAPQEFPDGALVCD